MPDKQKRFAGVITSGTVKSWKAGGGFVTVPSSMVGTEVWIIPKKKIQNIRIDVTADVVFDNPEDIYQFIKHLPPMDLLRLSKAAEAEHTRLMSEL